MTPDQFNYFQITIQLNRTLIKQRMETAKNIVLQFDIFAHRTLQRYRGEQSYRTLTGGIISLVLVALFVGLFANLTLDTFGNNIIYSDSSVSYDDDPTYSKVSTSPSKHFMFAIGLTGINLNASKRYFDIYSSQRMTIKNSSGTTKTKKAITLVPCTKEHWEGISDSITNSYQTLNFKEWLCPSLNQDIFMQGKYTSQTFKFAEIKVGKCTANNSAFPNTTCYNSTDIQNFLNSAAQFTFNFYFINPVINAGQKVYRSYYLEDRNYFSFDTYTGVSANLFFSEYTVTTDDTILPWKQESDESGVINDERAMGQNYRMISGEDYFKFYLRKGPSNYIYSRNFQKLDQTLSYIGGLFGTLALMLTFLNLYSKYSYQLDMGDRLFKQNSGGSFGSENFNFVLFLGYLIYLLFTKFNIYLNWKTMRKYHQCRTECEKQLGIDLLFKKTTHFEEISKIILEDHQQKMLLMVPRPTIQEARMNRKRFLVKSILYHQMDKKARDVFIEPEEYQRKLMQYLGQAKSNDGSLEEKSLNPRTLKKLHGDIKEGYKKAQEEGCNDPFSNRIMNKLHIQQITKGLVDFFLGATGNQNDIQREHDKPRKPTIQIFPIQQSSAQSFYKSSKVANNYEEEFQFGDLFAAFKKSSNP